MFIEFFPRGHYLFIGVVLRVRVIVSFDVMVRVNNLLGSNYNQSLTGRPANLENVFRGIFRVKKRDLPAKSGTVGRAHIEKYTAYRNQLRSKNTL